MYMAKNVGICYYMSMTLKDRIPKEFYSLFRTKNMDAYMQIVVALYEENNEVYASLGLTREECQIIIADTISKTGIVWQTDYNEDESDKDSGSIGIEKWCSYISCNIACQYRGIFQRIFDRRISAKIRSV